MTSKGASSSAFRVGRVRGYRRGLIWYLCYHENGKRCRPRVGPDREAAKLLASQVNAQLDSGSPACTNFEPVDFPELQRRWLEHHEQVRRSSLATIRRYRTATDHLVRFAAQAHLRSVASLTPARVEQFVVYLRELKVHPNGCIGSKVRPLRDKGLRFILEAGRALLTFARKRRHLPPYTENPFTEAEIDRLPVHDAKPFVDLTPEQEERLLRSFDAWEQPIFLTLAMTGLRPGELTHLLWPEDLDLQEGWLHVRNKPLLGWQVKTRNARSIPLLPELQAVLGHLVRGRSGGPLFLRHSIAVGTEHAPLKDAREADLMRTLEQRVEQAQQQSGQTLSRWDRQQLARKLWMDAGWMDNDTIRNRMMKRANQAGMPWLTTPKTLRHLFATALQDANVDPLIRNQLMGHASVEGSGRQHGGLGMTGVYTHTRAQTMREQLFAAIRKRPAAQIAVRLATQLDAARTHATDLR